MMADWWVGIECHSFYVNTKTAINGRMLGIIMGDETNTQWNEERQRDFHVNQLTRKEHCPIKGDIFIQARLHDLKCGGLTFRAKRKEPWPTAERKEHLSRLFPTALSTSLWSIGNLRQQLISSSCRLLSSFIFCLQQRLFNYTFYSISIFHKHVAD